MIYPNACTLGGENVTEKTNLLEKLVERRENSRGISCSPSKGLLRVFFLCGFPHFPPPFFFKLARRDAERKAHTRPGLPSYIEQGDRDGDVTSAVIIRENFEKVNCLRSYYILNFYLIIITIVLSTICVTIY